MFHIFETLLNFLITQDRSNSCDDLVDRLNRKYTVILLVIFVTVLNSKQYIGEPLSCFCPAHFTGAHVEYTNNICMISRSFYISMDRSYLRPAALPPAIASSFTSTSTTTTTTTKLSKISKLINFGFGSLSSDLGSRLNINGIESENSYINQYAANITNNSNYLRIENLIAYYPIFLIGQAILFYIPFFFWKNILSRSAYDLRTLVFIANECQYIDNQYERERSLRYLISHIERAYDYYNKIKPFSQKSNSNSDLKQPYLWLRDARRYISSHLNHCIDFSLNPFKKCSNLDDDFYSEQAQSIKASSTTTTTLSSNPTPFYSSILFRIYLFKKLLYIANSLFQFILLSKFVAGQTKSNLIYNEKNDEMTRRSDLTYLADNSLLLGFEFGYKAISSLIRTGNLFEESSMLLVFHTVVFCDFQIRMLGNRLQRYTIQCVVPINVYTEKIFTVMWFWLLFLTCLNIYNFCKWLIFYVSFNVRLDFVYSNSLNVNSGSFLAAAAAAAKTSSNQTQNGNGHGNENGLQKLKKTFNSYYAKENTSSSYFSQFSKIYKLYFHQTSPNVRFDDKLIRNYLIHDRIFILKLIAENTNEIVTKELVTLSVEILNKRNYINNENTV